MVPYRFARPWLLIDWVYRLTAAGKSEEQQQKDLFDFCFRKMKEKRELLRQNGSFVIDDETISAEGRKISLLEYMVEINERNPRFTDQDIIEECCTFMLAGQDSVGTAIAMTLFLLANNPTWQEKCIAELDEIFGDDERSPTMQDLREMKCLDMCIKESLRLYPSVPLFARTLGQDVRIGEVFQEKISYLNYILLRCYVADTLYIYIVIESFPCLIISYDYLALLFKIILYTLYKNFKIFNK